MAVTSNSFSKKVNSKPGSILLGQVFLFLLLFSCNKVETISFGVENDHLKSCPEKTKCLQERIKLDSNDSSELNSIASILKNMGAEIVSREDHYLHARLKKLFVYSQEIELLQKDQELFIRTLTFAPFMVKLNSDIESLRFDYIQKRY